MKKTLLLLSFMLTALWASAQCDYETLMKEGKDFYEKQQYRSALKKFNAARTCDPTQSVEVDKQIDKVFDAIEDQRDEAKDARNRTEVEKSKAEEERKKAEQAFQMAEEERKKVEIEKNKAVEALKIAAEMRDSARHAKQAEQQLLLLNESGELRQLGYSKFIEKNYERALFFFEKAHDLLKNAEIRDTIVATRMEVLQEKIEETKAVLQVQTQFRKYMAEGDTAFNTLGYAVDYKHALVIAQVDTNFNSGKLLIRAYKAYSAAKHLHFDSIQAQDRLYGVERVISGKAFPKRFLDGPGYYEVMLLSAETNLQWSQFDVSKKRIHSAVKYGFTDVTQIRQAGMRKYADREIKTQKLLGRFSLYSGFKQYFRTYYNNAKETDLKKSFSMLQGGMEYMLYKRLGFGLSYAEVPNSIATGWNIEADDYYYTPEGVRQTELSLYAFWHLFSKKTWWRKKALLQITPKAGYAFGKNWKTADYDRQYFNYDPPTNIPSLFNPVANLQSGITLKNPSGDELVSVARYGSDQPYISFEWYNADRDAYHNLLLGVRLELCPFVRTGLSLYLEPMWNFALERDRDTYSIFELDQLELISDFYDAIDYPLSNTNVSYLREQYFYYGSGYYRASDSGFYTGFSLSFGLQYQF